MKSPIGVGRGEDLNLIETDLSRRFLIAGGAALVATLAACGKKAKTPADAGSAASDASSIDGTVAGAWRSQSDRKEDADRHPVQTLAFLGLEPGATVVEMWPGAGWWSEILAPYLAATKGKFIAANLDTPNPDDPAGDQVTAAYIKHFSEAKDRYGDITFTSFGPHSGPLAPAGTADLVLMHTINNWMAAGLVEKAFRDAYAALKPGGALGVIQPRANPGGVQDALAANGYVQQDYVKQLAAEAGFHFDKASEINANPKDTKNHPFGEATLPPTRRSSPLGSPPNLLFDHKKYDSIGEADRMTLRFVKP